MAQGTAVESSVPENELPLDLGTDGIDEQPDGADAQAAAMETRARKMGWRPLAEFRGDPARWRPAAEYLDRGQTMLPIVLQQNRELTDRLTRVEGRFAEVQTTAQEQLQIIKDLRDMGAKANQAGYDRAMAEIKAKQRQAVEAGDTGAYDQLVEQAEALRESRPATMAEPAARATPTKTSPAPLTAAVRGFIAENPWFNADKLLSDTMVGFHREILNERGATQEVLNADPELDRELLEEAKARVAERYPERFGAPAARTPAPREPAPMRPARRAAAVAAPTAEPPAPRPGAAAAMINSIADPAERTQARDAFTRMKRQMPDYTEAEYMALYVDPHGDVLAIQRQKPRKQANER